MTSQTSIDVLPISCKISYTVPEAAKIIGLGVTRLYQEVNAGRLKAVKLGRRTLIPRVAIEAWLGQLEAYPVANGDG